MAQQQHQYGDWKKLKVLGSGGFGQVSLWMNTQTEEKIAVKICRQQLQERHLQRWQQEVDIMKNLDHPSIVKYHDVPADIQKNYVGTYVALGMEFCEKGDLRKMLGYPENCCGLQEYQVRYLLNDIGSAISFLHEKKIVHRDLKPENIVMKQIDRGRLLYKIIDLGYAKDLNQHSCGTSFVGTLHYLAPEFFGVQALRYTATVDFWSFGLVAFECITGRRPFFQHLDAMQALPDLKERKTDEHICTVERDGHTQFLSEIPQPHALNDIFADKISAWLKIMLRLDPDQRGGGDGKNGWFKKLQQILDEKHIRVFNSQHNEIIPLQIVPGMRIRAIQERVAEVSSFQDNLLLFKNGDNPDVTQPALKQCWKPPSSEDWLIFMYRRSNEKFEAPNMTLPDELSKLISEPRIRLTCKEARHLLNITTNFMCTRSVICEHAASSLYALTLSVQKRSSYCTTCIRDLKKSYYRFLGYIEFFTKSVKADIEYYDELEEQKLINFEDFANDWTKKQEEVQELESTAVEITEKLIGEISLELSNASSQVRKAIEICERSKATLAKKVHTACDKHNSVRSDIRQQLDLHRNEKTQQAAKTVDLHAVMRDLILNFVLPSTNEFSFIFSAVAENIKHLLGFYHLLSERVPEIMNVHQSISNNSSELSHHQSMRQEELWGIIKDIKCEAEDIRTKICHQIQDVGTDDNLSNVTNEMDENRSKFFQLVAEIVGSDNISGINSLSWDYLDVKDSLPSTSNDQNCTVNQLPPEEPEVAISALPSANENCNNNNTRPEESSVEISPEERS